ncbi:MAG: GNAT family N-acetyltransferase [Pseudonocardiaceae bacterium]|nr:GNAT family N-acetyltransferase [Pseudonocardiaceae bacterium]
MLDSGIASPGGRHPGWPARLGSLRVAAGSLALRPVRWRDGAAWSRFRLRDEDYLRPWEPDASGRWDERHARTSWPLQCSGLRSMARRGHALPFAITVDGDFAGQLTLGNVVRGALCSAWVGYWVESELAGGGVATGAVALAVDHAFGPVRLHRIEATVQPDNAASLRVLRKLGFRDEGLLLRYLEVAGRWCDHSCLAITREEVGESMVARLRRDGRAH